MNLSRFLSQKKIQSLFSHQLILLILETKFYDDKINFYSNDNNFRAIGRFSNDTISGRYKNQVWRLF